MKEVHAEHCREDDCCNAYNKRTDRHNKNEAEAKQVEDEYICQCKIENGNEKGEERGGTETDSKDDKEDDKEAEIKELIETLQRLQAEFENYRKRTENEKLETIKTANKKLIKEMLPIVDNFLLALKNTSDPCQFVKGIELVYAQFQEILKNYGVEKLPTENFNPEMHEAIMYGEGKEGKILEVFQDGYMIDSRILRPARVKVGKKEK